MQMIEERMENILDVLNLENGNIIKLNDGGRCVAIPYDPETDTKVLMDLYSGEVYVAISMCLVESVYSDITESELLWRRKTSPEEIFGRMLQYYI